MYCAMHPNRGCPRGPGATRWVLMGETSGREKRFTAQSAEGDSPELIEGKHPWSSPGWENTTSRVRPRPGRDTVSRGILRLVLSRGNVRHPAHPSLARTYDRRKWRKSRGSGLTSRSIELSHTQDSWPLDDSRFRRSMSAETAAARSGAGRRVE